MPDRSDASRVNGMELIFRETLRSDIEGLFSVRARTRENPISKEQLASLGITAESIAKQMASGRMKGWVCLDSSSTLVGFCNGDAETGEVLVLAVLPDYEGRGIGTHLLSRVVEWLRSVGSHTIWLAGHRTREYERMAFIVPLDGGRMVKLTKMMTKSSSSSPASRYGAEHRL